MRRLAAVPRLTRWAGWIVATALTLFLGLNLYWIFGGRWGMAEVMGAPGVEPPPWVVWVQAAMVATAVVAVLGRSGALRLPIRSKALNAVVWLLAGVLAVVAIGSFASPSAWEKYVLGPTELALAGLTALVASAPAPAPSGADSHHADSGL